MTFDSGTENVWRQKVREDYEYSFRTFFCDSYCFLHKESVESTNKLLRQYFPRNISAKELTQNSGR
jgi:IS30 family transposase